MHPARLGPIMSFLVLFFHALARIAKWAILTFFPNLPLVQTATQTSTADTSAMSIAYTAVAKVLSEHVGFLYGLLGLYRLYRYTNLFGSNI